METNLWEKYSGEKRKPVEDFCKDYKQFLSTCKTERECIKYAIKKAEEKGFMSLEKLMNSHSTKKLKPGDKVYGVNMNKAIVLFVVGKQPIEYGINIGDMQPDDLKLFIEKVTRAVYSYIKVKAGLTNYAKMMYRIAKGLGAKNLTKQDFRKIFLEDVLIVQAEKMTREGYAKDMPKTIITETGRTKAVDLAENDGYWLHDDVITTLDALNLTNSQYIKNSNIDWSEY